MSLLEDLRYLFTAPSELFYDLDENPRFLRPLVVNLLLYFISILAAYFLGNFIQMPEDFSFLLRFGILFITIVFLAPLMILLVNALQSFGYYVGTKAVSYDVSYKTLLSIAMYAFIILSIGKTLETLINSIIGINDYFSFSPAFFLENTVYSNSIISILLKLINPFTIWYVLLMASGISVTSEMGKVKAIGIVIFGNVIFWILFSLIAVIIYLLVFIVSTLLR